MAGLKIYRLDYVCIITSVNTCISCDCLLKISLLLLFYCLILEDCLYLDMCEGLRVFCTLNFAKMIALVFSPFILKICNPGILWLIRNIVNSSSFSLLYTCTRDVC